MWFYNYLYIFGGEGWDIFFTYDQLISQKKGRGLRIKKWLYPFVNRLVPLKIRNETAAKNCGSFIFANDSYRTFLRGGL